MKTETKLILWLWVAAVLYFGGPAVAVIIYSFLHR